MRWRTGYGLEDVQNAHLSVLTQATCTHIIKSCSGSLQMNPSIAGYRINSVYIGQMNDWIPEMFFYLNEQPG